MPSISETGPFTVVVQFEVDPSNQQALVNGLSTAITQYFRTQPGFISASLHASHDGRRVVNYAQWQSEQVYNTAQAASGEGRAHVQTLIHRLSTSIVDSRSYIVQQVIEPTT